MRQGKRPTRQQKVFISGLRLSPYNWLVISDTKESITIIHRHTNTIRTIKKIL